MWSLHSAPLNSRKNSELPQRLARNLANTRSPCTPTCHTTCSSPGNTILVLASRLFLVLFLCLSFLCLFLFHCLRRTRCSCCTRCSCRTFQSSSPFLGRILFLTKRMRPQLQRAFNSNIEEKKETKHMRHRVQTAEQTHPRVRAKSILRSILRTFTLVEQPHDTRRERGHAVGSINMRSLVPWNMDAAKRHDIGVRILANINVTLRQERSVVDSAGAVQH